MKRWHPWLISHFNLKHHHPNVQLHKIKKTKQNKKNLTCSSDQQSQQYSASRAMKLPHSNSVALWLTGFAFFWGIKQQRAVHLEAIKQPPDGTVRHTNAVFAEAKTLRGHRVWIALKLCLAIRAAANEDVVCRLVTWLFLIGNSVFNALCNQNYLSHVNFVHRFLPSKKDVLKCPYSSEKLLHLRCSNTRLPPFP